MGVPMSWRRAQWIGAAALAVLPLGFLALRCSFSSEISFIRQTSEAPWLIAPRPVNAILRQWGDAEIPVDTFKGRFDLPASNGPVHGTLRAMRRFKLWVNGNALSPGMSEETAWRIETRVDLTPWLRPGRNEIWVEVANPSGPRCSRSASKDFPRPWRRIRRGGWRAAGVSSASLASPTTHSAIRERWPSRPPRMSSGNASTRR